MPNPLEISVTAAEIFRALGPLEAFRVRLVCKQWRELIEAAYPPEVYRAEAAAIVAHVGDDYAAMGVAAMLAAEPHTPAKLALGQFVAHRLSELDAYLTRNWRIYVDPTRLHTEGASMLLNELFRKTPSDAQTHMRLSFDHLMDMLPCSAFRFADLHGANAVQGACACIILGGVRYHDRGCYEERCRLMKAIYSSQIMFETIRRAPPHLFDHPTTPPFADGYRAMFHGLRKAEVVRLRVSKELPHAMRQMLANARPEQAQQGRYATLESVGTVQTRAQPAIGVATTHDSSVWNPAPTVSYASLPARAVRCAWRMLTCRGREPAYYAAPALTAYDDDDS